MVVKVAIDLALDRLFDYEVPEALKRKLAVGQLLSVPFGRREARGFAVEIGERTAPPSAKLKPVSSICEAKARFVHRRRDAFLFPVAPDSRKAHRRIHGGAD